MCSRCKKASIIARLEIKIKKAKSQITEQRHPHSKASLAWIKSKYGVDNIFEDKAIIEKSKKTNIEKYGTEYAIQSDIVKEKRKNNNLKKYGVEYPSQLQSQKDLNINNGKAYFENKLKAKGYLVLNYFQDNTVETYKKINTNL